MITQITDNDLIDELRKRFELNITLIREQDKLMRDLKKVNNMLIQSEKMKSTFLSNIRNEINNPLTAIIELSKTISKPGVEIVLIHKYVKMIYSEIYNLNFQLKNIFASAEIEAGASDLKISAVEISSLITNITESFKHQLDKKQINLTITSDINNKTQFYTDPEKLHLIISNILSNAIVFNADNGKIEINYYINKINQLIIKIYDSGIGIRPENKEIIFNRFTQLDEGASKSYSGHGLGLSVSKELLDLINGTIELFSEIDKGSTFTLRINALEKTQNNNNISSFDGNDFFFESNPDKFF